MAEKFKRQGAEPAALESYINQFTELKDRNQIQGTDRDINSWGKKSFAEFKTFVDSVAAKLSKTKERKKHKKEGAELFLENAEWKILKILDHKACKLYGSGTQWCISGRHKEHWEAYAARADVYIMLSKTKLDWDRFAKIAVVVDTFGRREVWDATNDQHFFHPSRISHPIMDDVNSIPFPNGNIKWDLIANDDNFMLKNVLLESLEGAPEKVGGNFVIYESRVNSLAGGPKTVRNFLCAGSHLSSLEGAPKVVGGEFDCSSNHLFSLVGAPKEVGGSFNCSYNILSSLEGMPEKVGGSFSCRYNKLTSLVGVPRVINGNFDCSGNPLTSLEGIPESVGGNFYISPSFAESAIRAVCKVGGSIFHF